MKRLFTIFLPLFVSSALLSQITLEQFPKSLQLYPRDVVTNTARVHISGTAASGVDSLIFTLEKSNGAVEKRALSLNDLVNGQFEVSFDIVAGLWSYDIRVERKNAGNITLLEEAVNVVAGDVFVIQGQSNAQSFAYSGDANGWQNNFVRCFGTSNPTVFNDENWYFAEGNGYFSSGAVGQWPLRMGYMLQENLQIPVAIINGADPGKPIEFFQRNDAQHEDSTTNYGRLLQRLNNAGVTNRVRAMMYYQGESDGGRAEIHKTLFEALHADWEENLPNIEAYYVVQVREGCGGPSLQLREYQRAFEGYLLHAKGVTANGINGHDGCHYDVQGYKTLGEKVYKQISADLYNTPTGEQTNIRVLSASFTNDLNAQITVLTDATTALTAQNGSAYDFKIQGASAAVISIQADGNKLILELDQSVNSPNAGLSYSGHAGNNAWVLNADGYGMFTFYNLLIDNYHIVPNFDIPGIMSGSGNCLSLDGIDDFVDAGSVLSASYTKEAWVNWQGGTQANNIISGAQNTAFWVPNGVLSAGHNSAWWQVADNVTLTPNQWTHVAVSYAATSGELSLYKNGKLISQAQNVPAHNDPVVYIGAYGGCCTFQGKIDEVRIWDTVRTINEIRANMCQKLLGTESNLSSYFRFDETSGDAPPNAASGPDGKFYNIQATGLNEAWQRSGAPIGTKSTFTYNDADELSLTIPSGDSLVLSTLDVPDFVHLYFVEEVPNVLEPAEDYVLVDNARYFGLFYANQSINNYDLKYFYVGNPFAFVQDQNLGLLQRRNNAQAFWGKATQFVVNQDKNNLIATGTLYQEYILAIKDSLALSPLNAQLAVTQTILCSGLNDGSINVTAVGGQLPHTFSLNGAPPQSSALFTGLTAGNYAVVVMDQLGNSITTNLVTLQSPIPLVVLIAINDNNAVITVEGGTPPYVVNSNAPDPDLQNLPNGTYNLLVMDANGCQSNSSFIIDYQPIAATITWQDNSSCDGLADLVVEVSGGEPPYQYSLNNGAYQFSNTFQDLPPGIYSVTVLDFDGKLTELGNIENNISLAFTAATTVDGDTIFIAASGGVAPYMYRLNGGIFQPDPVFTGVGAGIYTIEVIDAEACNTMVEGIIITSGTKGPNASWRISVSPNPSTGIFQITGKDATRLLQGSVFDVTGSMLQNFDFEPAGSSAPTSFDLSLLADGIYFLRITDGGRFQNIRLVKMR